MHESDDGTIRPARTTDENAGATERGSTLATDDAGLAAKQLLIGAGALVGLGAGGAAAAAVVGPTLTAALAPVPTVTPAPPVAAGSGTGRSGSTAPRSPRTPASTPTPAPTPAPGAPDTRSGGGGTGRRGTSGSANRDQSAARATGTTSTVPAGTQRGTYSLAAAAAHPIASTVFTSGSAATHLLRRATMGVAPADVADLAARGIDAWIDRQLDPDSIPDPDGDAAWASFPAAGASIAAAHAPDASTYQIEFQTSKATIARQVFSSRQLYENVVDMMSSQLHVAMPGDESSTSADYTMNVIRRYALGKYSEMLKAAMRHPAMLLYLSAAFSTKDHVNENLGRELLELHTVGVGAGYTEADVVASAKILTGRSIDYTTTEFLYRANFHWVGPLTVMGFTTPNPDAADGLAVGDAYLDYLAHHPSTARMIARRIAVRFVEDLPSDDLVQRLANVYLANDTSIKATVAAVFLSTDFWNAVGTRSRRPLEDAIGAARALGMQRGTSDDQAASILYYVLAMSNHLPYGWPPPNGFPDVTAAWANAGGMVQRWNLHRRMLTGGVPGASVPSPTAMVPLAGKSSRAWVQALSVRLTGETPTDAHTSTLLGVAGLSGTEPATALASRAVEIAALILDSPLLQLR